MTDISPLPVSLLACPICGLPLVSLTLSETGSALQCAHHHSFDVAREHYTNLLLKKAPGDTKEMLQARRQFFAAGYYAPLASQINELVLRYLLETGNGLHPSTDQQCTAILDAGCGEGYYLGSLKHSLDSQSPDLACCYIGLDSSKEAIRLAARRYRDIGFIVASIKERLPLLDNSIQVLLNIFAPRNAPEFARVLAPGGLLLVVIPGPNHLQPLRTLLTLLNIEQDKQQHVSEQFAPWFVLRQALPLHYTLTLDKAAIAQLLQMTPNAWHPSPRTQQALENIEQVETEIAFICLVYQQKT